MELSDIQPIPNEPALFIKNKKILVIADLHIGIEKELRSQGLNVPYQTKKMTDHVDSICKKYKPKEIIILGDVKHNIPSSTNQERNDVKNFLKKISEFGKIKIIPGNHDGNIKRLCDEEIKILPSEGFINKNIGFFHGHRWPSEKLMECEQIVLGHTHPTIMFTDRLGYNIFEPCWVRGILIEKKLKEKYPNSKSPLILVIPAFNPFCGGVAVNKQGITGPIGRIVDIKKSNIYLIDGTSLGKVKDIK